ncbi:MAG: DUF485 domain-containing protein [Microbacterium sp.]
MTDSPEVAPQGTINYIAEEKDPKFRELKTRRAKFVFPLAIVFLLWYMLYVILACYARDFMSQEIGGHITVGLLLGLAQFVTTFIITMAYVSFANKKLDPLAEEIRDDLETRGGAQ